MGPLSAIPGIFVLALMIVASGVVYRIRPRLRQAVLDESASGRFIPQLEGLRGLMAAAVVLHHAAMFFVFWPSQHVWQLPENVFYSQLAIVPVLMFFFLTGFLFWSKLLKRPQIQGREFLSARFRRLGPVYLFAMALLFFQVAALTHFQLRVPIGNLLWSCARWLCFALMGEPDINRVGSTVLLIAGTPWSLAYEWQFYVLLLALPWFARKPHRCLYLLCIAGILYEVTRWRLLQPTQPGPIGAWLLEEAWGLSGHVTWSFGIGILVASLRHVWPELRWRTTGIPVTLLCVVLMGWALFSARRGFYIPELSLVMGFVFLCIAYGNDFFGLLRSKPMMVLGRCSYSLYLCHGLVLSGIHRTCNHINQKLLPLPWIETWVLIALSSLLALAFAVLCHELVEAPFMVKRRREPTGLPALRRMPPAQAS